MFRRIGLLGFRTARSDEGFDVRFRGMTKLVYKEGDHVPYIGVEPERKLGGYAVYFGDIKTWDPPFENEPITSGTREKIRERVLAALAFIKIEHLNP
jgi:hypothetical protein